MMRETEKQRGVDREGFVLPVVLFGLLLMGTMSVAALMTADDESRSGRAMREATGAFYAAEAGLNEVYATWDSVAAPAVDTLAGGASVDLGWRTLDNGAMYRAEIRRWDEGSDQPIFQLTVTGKSGTAERELSYTLTSDPAGVGEGYMLGECCAAAITMKGTYGQRTAVDTLTGVGGRIVHSGFDVHPPNWEDADVCSDSLYDKPGLVMSDTTQIERLDVRGGVSGVPPILEDPGITDAAFDTFGDYTWQDIKDRATIIIENGYIRNADGSINIQFDSSLPSQKLKGTDHIRPRYTVDPMTGEMLCDTDHPMNWGSDDPNDPCFDHFPIILINGELDMVGEPAYGRFYGQGIIIANFNEVAGTGAEIEFEAQSNFRGVTMGKGCIELQKGTQYYGAVFLDATYDGVTCDKSYDMYTDCYPNGTPPCLGQTLMQWSQCAVDRALVESGLYELAEPTIPPPGGVERLGNRSFMESFR
jgi:Tfp pilus assembly protein PilX